MTGFELATLVLVSVWLGLLSVVVLLLVRQLGLIALHLDHSPAAPQDDRFILGTPLPESIREHDPGFGDRRVYLLFVSAACAPCRRLAAELKGADAADIDEDLRIVLAGSGELEEELAEWFPRSLPVIRDPLAKELVAGLGVTSTPVMLSVERGVVNGWSYPQEVADLRRLIDANARINASEYAERMQEVMANGR